MDRSPPLFDTLDALELRVLEGPQAGARAALAAGASCVVASAPDGRAEGADIVLRDERTAPARVRVEADAMQARIEVLEGRVRLGEQTLDAGAQADWPKHAPLRLGASVVAFGLACEDDWSSVAALLGAPPAPRPARPRADAAPASAVSRPWTRRAEVWLAATGTAVLLACAGSLWMAHAAAAPAPAPAAPAPLAAALRASEFAALQTTVRADGSVVVGGRLATLAQRARLDAWLAARREAKPPAVEVAVDEALAHDVTEIFRINGVTVKAAVAAPGRIVAEASEPDAQRLARAEDVVRRDIRGLESLAVRNTATPPPPPAPPLPDDPGKRIASLVPGEPAYVVTADGSRYFVGAMLPSGHRIAGVAATQLTLERDGRRQTLNF